ncbi:MAG: response regulator [Magnetococcales bacterium]|nr:response regulator [Magnetococcales bacterium]
MTHRIRAQIIFPIFILLFLGGFVFWAFLNQQGHIASHVEHMQKNVLGHFHEEVQRDVALMQGALASLSRHPALQEAFLAGDAERLLALANPIYQELNQTSHITHFYFTALNRVNFLRIHSPNRHGDRIDRFTTLEAQRTGKSAFGLEMGPLGTFTLRVVLPWRRNGELIGYLELGEEIDHLLDHIRTVQDVGIQVFIDKAHLDQKQWSATMDRMGRANDWAQYGDHVQISQTQKGTNTRIAELLAGFDPDAGVVFHDISFGDGHETRVGLFPLQDARKRVVGLFFIHLSMSQHGLGVFLDFVWMISAPVLVAGAALIYLVYSVMRSREQIRHQLKWRQDFLNALPIPVYYTDRESRFLECNTAFEKLLNISRKELIGKSAGEVFPSGKQGSALGQSWVGSELPAIFETTLPGPWGEARHLVFHKDRLRAVDGGSSGVIGAILDITSQVETDRALLKAKEQAESANQAKTAFLANVSHEIRSPLNAIVGFAQILFDNRDEIPTRYQHYLENIRISGDNLAEIINNVLDLAKIEAGKEVVEKEAIEIRLLVQSLHHINKVRAGEKGVVLTYDVAPEIPRLILSDRTKVNQILMNLVVNAIKFTPSGGSVAIRVAVAEEWLVFRVADEGVGIPPDKLTTIFEPFEQVQDIHNTQQKGTGLGLSIVKSLTGLLGGTVEVESEPGRGTLFTVGLPLEEVDEPAREGREQNWHHYTFPSDLHLLLVDDNPLNREMLQTVLERVGLQVTCAENGALGVARARELVPDMILMDFHMPVMDGLTATGKIRSDPQLARIPIIGVSADALVGRKEECLAGGMNEFLTKPVDLEALLPILARYLARGERADDGALSGEVREMPGRIQREVRAGLQEIAALPLYESGRIVGVCDRLLGRCQGYHSPFLGALQEIREAVFSRNSKKIPEILAGIADRDP